MNKRQMWLAILLVVAVGNAAIAATERPDRHIERLTWAGIKLVAGDTTVLIDAVGTDIWNGRAPGGLVPVSMDTGRRYALITHAHGDHFDPTTLKDVLGETGYVICHESIATHVASRGLRVIPAATYTAVFRGGFSFMPVPAADGFGAEQVSWVVTQGDKRFLHAGDTLWHGKWGDIGRQYGPFDTVFLPVNGARISQDPMPETPGVLTPEQAVDAAILLRAASLVPIHYGYNDPPDYVEVDSAEERLLEAASRRKLSVRRLKAGEIVVF